MFYKDELTAMDFETPGGNSALRRATPSNPRIYPCLSCRRPNQLTAADVALHYQCDACADHDEGLGPDGNGDY